MKRTKVAQEIRRQEVANSVGQGKRLEDLAEELQVHARTIKRDLALLRKKYAGSDMTTYELKVKEYKAKIAGLEAATWAGVSPRIMETLLHLAQEDAKVDGLYAPTKSIGVRVDANQESLVGYRRFMAETRHLSERDLERLWEFCRNLQPATDRSLSEPPIEGGETCSTGE